MDLLSLYNAVERDHLVGLAPLLFGLVVVAALIGAVWLGRRLKAREPDVPKGEHMRSGAWQTREEYGHETPSNHGPGHQETLGEGEVMEERHHDHSPELRKDGRRRMPYELGGYGEEETRDDTGGTKGPDYGAEGEAGSARQDPQDRPTWDRGGSGHGTG
ncbi:MULTISPECIES: DUF6479 family protein [Streptomyces]|uniref:Secreted protein n=1 Tax=Streptomyces lycii TaxID=2654337 RepID=A0ABQ7FR51_9ACTN|nr:DUF6479 family protein [Streptomyces lycii]KAF4409778.1 hypothetical protein GCU69_07260 [Streptomyces lycii]